MARPMKDGLDYYTRPVGWLHDKPMRKLMRACGPAAVAVIDEIDGLIYGRKGYYLDWDEDTQFDVADALGVKETMVAEVVKKAVEIGLYDAGIFAGDAVLTNAVIQDQYLYATKKRKSPTPTDYMINANHNRVNAGINSVMEPGNAHKRGVNPHSKEKKSKEKDSKVPKAPGGRSAFTAWQELWGAPNAIATQDLMQWTEEFGDDLVTWVIDFAARRNVKARAADGYLDRTLVRFRDAHITTIAQAEAEAAKYREKVAAAQVTEQRPRKGARIEAMPDWAKPGYSPPHEPQDPEQEARIARNLAALKALQGKGTEREKQDEIQTE